MADENEEITMRGKDDASESGTSSGSGSGSESEEEQTDWLATSRQKRSTAGNRLSSLLQQEEPDDELELLFAEADDDAAFEENSDGSDVQMDSSDDDDQGPAAGADDLEGEKEIEREAKAERQAKKRKLNDGIPKILKKRVRIDPRAMQAPPPRPKKKSERLSWLPTAEEQPTRASLRDTTRQSKEQLHAQMVDRELKRLKQLKNMEKAAAAKEAAKKPALTQADRMAEAARVEKSNSKSLNRWQEAELQREEGRRAKLAALNKRQLDGPVITWWSGMAEWIGGNLKKVGKVLTLDDPKEKPRKRKAAEMEADSEAAPSTKPNTSEKPSDDASAASNPVPNEPASTGAQPQPNINTPTPVNVTTPTTSTEVNGTPSTTNPPAKGILQPPVHLANIPIAPIHNSMYTPSNFLQPPPHLANLPNGLGNPPRATGVLQPPAHLAHLSPGQSPYSYIPPLDGSAPLPGFTTPFTHPPPQPQALQPPSPPPPPPPAPPAIEHATKNYLILTNFEDKAVKDKDTQMQILMECPDRTFHKATKSKNTTLCAITSYPAKFRDPSTGLSYFNSYAYREIHKLKRGEYKWSKLLGAYVGQGTYAARGVPVRFLNPSQPQAEKSE